MANAPPLPPGGWVNPDDSAEPLTVHADHAERSLSEDLVRRVAEAVAEMESVTYREVGIVLADHDAVRAVNREWLDHDWETDVVSFCLDEAAARGEVIEGEVYVDLDTAAERAPEFGVSFEQEALRYVAHGLLHLTGYDDAAPEQRKRMRTLETCVLQRAGVL